MNFDFDLECYKVAGSIASDGIKYAKTIIKPGCKISDLCAEIDKFLINKLSNVYKKIRNKGLSFPTSISLNNIVGYYSPFDKDSETISDNCVVYIELGTHIDNYPAKCGTTITVGDVDEKVTQMIKDVKELGISCMKTFKVGKSNMSTKKKMNKYMEEKGYYLPYVTNPNLKTPGLYSYQMSRGVLDGFNEDDIDEDDIHKMIIHRDHSNYDFTSQESEYERNEVYCLDLLICSEDSKLVPIDERVTIFRRDLTNRYSLKLQFSKKFLGLFQNNKFARTVSNEDYKLMMGLRECMTHNLVIPYGVFKVKNGFAARFQLSVVVGNKNSILLTDFFSKE